jgi:putative chitinase
MNMMRAVDLVRAIAHNARPEYVAAWDAGDDRLNNAGINTPIRLAHLIGQRAAESGGFSVTREVMIYTHEDRLVFVFNKIRHSPPLFPGEAAMLLRQEHDLAERFYGPGGPSPLYAAHHINNGINPGNVNKARALGNLRQGDGFVFRGNGMLQTTGGDAHKKAGENCGADFFNHPELLTSAEFALQPVLFEWTSARCNGFADADDLLTVSRAINIGDPHSTATPVGMDDRKHWLGLAKRALHI